MRGQVQHPINWILVVFAGAFFLLLFFAIARVVVDQGEGTSGAVTISRLSNIIEQTKANPDTITTASLPEITTACVASGLRIESAGQERTIGTHPIFAAEHIKGKTTMISKEFSVYNPVTTLTYLIPHSTLYVFHQNVPTRIRDRFEELPKITYVNSQVPIDAEGFERVVIVSLINEQFPTQVTTDGVVYGLQFDINPSSKGELNFYSQDTGSTFSQSGSSYYYQYEDLLVAAITSAKFDDYNCMLNRLEEQLHFLNEVHLARLAVLDNTDRLECFQIYERVNVSLRDIKMNGLDNAKIQGARLKEHHDSLGVQSCPDI